MLTREDYEMIDQIIQRIKEKYEKEGISLEEETGDILKAVMEGRYTEEFEEIGEPEDLLKYKNDLIRLAGAIYLKLEGILGKIYESLKNSPKAKELNKKLYAAGLPFTANQYIPLVLVFSIFAGIFGFFFGFLIFPTILLLLFKLNFFKIPVMFMMAIIFMIGFTLFGFALGLRYPDIVVKRKAKNIEKELPFALRHLSIEIRAGVSLHGALRAIAKADYGDLSEEIDRTLGEIGRGIPTDVALKKLANRVESMGFRRAINQIIRAMTTGGNLVNIIEGIAEDIAFELRMKIVDFAEKMNFYGLLFMYFGIVGPVIIGIISALGYAPTGSRILSNFAIPMDIIWLIYSFFLPLCIGMMLWMIIRSDPMG
jgi:flagellar protein FlaJ